MRGVLRRVGGSPSLFVALVALVVALSGTSYAALKLPRNSVGAAQIKKNAVTSSEVKNRSLRLGDLSGGARTVLKGERGPAGERGPQGLPGTGGGGAGVPTLFYRRADVSVGEGEKTPFAANCLAGEHATGGGADVQQGDTAVIDSFPKADGTGWWVTVENNNDSTDPKDTTATGGPYKLTVYAVCVQSSAG